MPDCANCGAQIPENEAACPSCGAPTPGATASFEPVGAGAPDEVLTAEGLEGPVLIVCKGPQPGERFYLDREKLTVGRDPDSDIFLNDMTVSRSHAVLWTRSGEVTVEDSGSLNGTYVNDLCVEQAVLTDGDVLRVGTFQMSYHGPEVTR